MTVHWVFDNADTLLTMTACPHTVVGDKTELVSGRFPMANIFHYFRNYWWDDPTHIWLHSGLADRPRNYAYNIGTWNDASYWTGWEGNTYGFENFLCYVPDAVMSDAREGRALLVIDNLNEGFYDARLYQFLHDSCTRFKLPPKTIMFLTGNELDTRGYAEWCEQHSITDRITVMGFPHLMYMQMLNLRNSTQPSWQDHTVVKTKHRSIANYNCLNRVNRNHRELFVMKLIDRDLHTHGMVSHNTLSYHAWTDHGVPQSVIDKATALLPLVVDDADFDNNKAMHINTNLYLNSWCSVITETHAFDELHNLFVSEKLWKPVFALQPFMVWGQRGTLAQLHRWGYETFDCLWDESYDQLDDLQRLDAILDNIHSLSVIKDKTGWLDQAREICVHNQRHFMSQNWFQSQYHDQFMAVYRGLNS